MDPPAPPPELPEPPAPQPPELLGPVEAVCRLQRWYRAQARRRRFLVIVNRARRRRKYLEERRRVAQRVYATEAPGNKQGVGCRCSVDDVSQNCGRMEI